MFWNLVYDKAYFEVYPIFNWKPVMMLKGDMGTLGRESDNPAQLRTCCYLLKSI